MTAQRVIGIVALFITLGLAACHRPKSAALPAFHSYIALPPQFNQALQRLHEQHAAQPADLEIVRKLAYVYQANRLYTEAKACYSILASRSPGLTAHDHYYLADLAQAEGDAEQALQEMRIVVARDSSYLPARVALAETLFKSGHEEEAGKVYEEILASVPNQPQASIGLARLALQRGDDKTAVVRLEKLLEAHSNATSGAALLAQIMTRQGNTDRAQALATWSLQKRDPVPEDPWMTALLTECYESQRLALKFEEYFFSGQIKEAVPFLDRLAELDPKGWLPPLLRGWSQAQAHQDSEAVKEYRNALERGGDPEKLVPLMVTSLLALNQSAEAAAFAADYYAKRPASQPILLAYTDAMTRVGDDAKTRILLSKLLEKEPFLYAQNLSLAKILWSAGEREEAAKCLRRIVQAFPNDVASRGLLAQYYIEKSDPVGAIGPLEQAMQQASTPAELTARLKDMLATAYLQGAGIETQKAHFEQALSFYEKAERLLPNELNVYLGKAGVLVQLKQFARAAETLEKMAVLQPDNPTIVLSLGDVRYQNGEEAEARRRWQQALQLTPASDLELRKVLDNRIAGRISVEDFR